MVDDILNSYEHLSGAYKHGVRCSCGLRFESMHELRLHNGVIKTWGENHWGKSSMNNLAYCAARHMLVVG